MGTVSNTPDPAERLDEVLVTSGRRGTLHIPNGDRPLCASAGEFTRKPLAVYPPAHRTWCRACRRLWTERYRGSNA